MRYNLHTHLATNESHVIEIVNLNPQEFNPMPAHFSIGTHPFQANLNTMNAELQIIESKLQQPNCVALGECGLDKGILIPFHEQKTIFIEQIKLAEKYNKPIIVHCVSAYQEVIQLKKEQRIQVPIIIHGFAKSSLQLANDLIKHDLYLSFGKHLLVNAKLAEVFKSIPTEHCFLETDSMSNGTIHDMYKKAQALKGLQVDEIIKTNFKNVFNI